MDKVKCAVIGAGWWGTTAHIPALQKHPNAELIAIQHHEDATSKRIAQDFAIPTVSTDPEVELAAQKNRQLMVGCTWHFTPHAEEARKAVQSGRLGKVNMISILMTNLTEGLFRGLPFVQAMGGDDLREEHQLPYLQPGRRSYSDPDLCGGGQIYCQVSHPAAYVGLMTGRRPVEVYARFENDGAAVDIYNAINVKLDDGTLLSLASNGAATNTAMHWELRVHGTEGVLVQELWLGTLSVHDRKGNVEEFEPLAAEGIYPMYEPTIKFVDCVRGEAPNRSPGECGLFAMEIVEAACESARTGKNVVIGRGCN